MELKFKCPNCGLKSLIERYTDAVVLSAVKDIIIGGWHNDADTGNSSHYVWLTHRGQPAIVNKQQATYTVICKRCKFDLRVRNSYELIEWLSFQKMVDFSPPHCISDTETWARIRKQCIQAGEISQTLLNRLKIEGK